MLYTLYFSVNMLCSIKIYHTYVPNFSIWPFNPTPEVRGVCKVKQFACMLFFASFPLILIWNINKTAVWRTAIFPTAESHDLEVWPWLWVCIIMGSAHQLTVRNIWVMFNENLTNGCGDLKDTKLKGKSHDLEVWPWVCTSESLALHTPHWEEYLCEV